MTCMEKAPDVLDYKEWCFKSWKLWCDKNNCEIILLDEELVDRTRMKLFDIEQQAQNIIQPEETKYVEHNLKEAKEESAEEKYKKFQDFQF